MAGHKSGIPGYVVGLLLLVPSASLMVMCWMCPCLWVYKLWKRKPQPLQVDSIKHVRQTVNVEFSIPESVVGFVIGRKGTSVKQMEEQTGAKIRFKDKEDTKDKIVVITGRPSSVQSAQELIQSAVQDKLNSVKNQQTATLTLPQRAVGRVIGRGGANIRAIQRDSGAKVSMLSGSHSDTVRLCEVVGTPEQLSRAVALIQEQVATTTDTRPLVTYQSSLACKTGNVAELCLTPAIEFIPVFISSVDGLGGLWLQPIALEDPTLLEGLVADMTQYYTATPNKDQPMIKQGSLYASPFKHDDNWYRVRVIKHTDSTVDVVYVDYGDYDSIDQSQLRTLKVDYCSLKTQAVRCVLDNIIPTDGVWSEDGLTALEELTYSGQWKIVMARVTSTMVTPRVQLVDTSGDKDINAADSLVVTGHAIYTRETPHPHSLRYQVHFDTALLPYPSHVTLTNQSECSISYAQSPDLLFLRPIGYDVLLTQLCARMNYEYKNSKYEKMENLKTGDLVALSIPLDAQWYRGHVISFNQSDCSVLVRLLDYGIVVCVPDTQIRDLKKALCDEVMYCAPCALANVGPLGEEWSEETNTYLREAINEGSLVTIATTGVHRSVHNVAVQCVQVQLQDKSLSSELVSSGLAAEVKGRLEPEGKEEVGVVTEENKNVKFRWSGAGTVSVAGSFSAWKAVELKRRDTGEFETDLDVPSGQHEYKYFVDGAWVHDHTQPTTCNSYGTLNNIVDN